MRPIVNSDFYDYHIKKIITSVCEDVDIHTFADGDALEYFLSNHIKDTASAFLDDVTEWQGWDETLKQLKGQ